MSKMLAMLVGGSFLLVTLVWLIWMNVTPGHYQDRCLGEVAYTETTGPLNCPPGILSKFDLGATILVYVSKFDFYK